MAEIAADRGVDGVDALLDVTLEDDLQRSRLTVFFRLLLGIPHFIWLVLWGSPCGSPSSSPGSPRSLKCFWDRRRDRGSVPLPRFSVRARPRQ